MSKMPDIARDAKVVSDILNGKIITTDKTVSYFAQKLRSLRREEGELSAAHAELSRQKQACEQRIMVVRCEIRAYDKDLVTWHNEVSADKTVRKK